jgi:hypothetical protein
MANPDAFVLDAHESSLPVSLGPQRSIRRYISLLQPAADRKLDELTAWDPLKP